MDGIGHDGGDQGAAAGGGAHPEDVVVAPLDVHVVVLHQVVQDHVRARAAVEDIAYQVQLVHHPLDHVRQRPDQAVRLVDLDDRRDDVLEIIVLFRVPAVRLEQLLDDVGVVRIQ